MSRHLRIKETRGSFDQVPNSSPEIFTHAWNPWKQLAKHHRSTWCALITLSWSNLNTWFTWVLFLTFAYLSPAMEPVAQLASYLDKPVLGWISSNPPLKDKETYSTLIRTLWSITNLGRDHIDCVLHSKNPLQSKVTFKLQTCRVIARQSLLCFFLQSDGSIQCLRV